MGKTFFLLSYDVMYVNVIYLWSEYAKKPTRNVVQTDGKTHTDGGTELKFSTKKKKRESVNRGVSKDSRYVCTYSCVSSVPL